MMSDPTDQKMIDALMKPDAYPWRPASISLIETHISWVFLAGDRVVKVKRPVHFGFIDHSTIERRRHSCEEEVRLNRRTTDGVYLGVIAIAHRDGKIVVGGPGTPIEWATLMRRLSADDMLSERLRRARVPLDFMERLSQRLIAFHSSIAGECGGEAIGSTERQSQVISDNLTELRAFAGRRFSAVQLEFVARAIHAFLEDNRALLKQRNRDGWIRDGHGDLRAEHICLENGHIQIFDCVEFSSAIRCADIASDLAFLLVDLERLGAYEMAAGIEARYRLAGIDLPSSLLRLYRAHRSLVRVKTGSLTLMDQHLDQPGLTDNIRVHLNLATRAALTFTPFLVVMTGLSGTGKSTVAQALAQATGAALYSSDAIRKELTGVLGGTATDWNAGIYAAEWTERTYLRLGELASAELADGKAAILDATFLDNHQRRTAAAIGARAGAPVVLVETTCDEATAAARLFARTQAAVSISDATLATHQRQRTLVTREHPEIPSGISVVTVDTSHGRSGELDLILAALEQARALVTRISPQ